VTEKSVIASTLVTRLGAAFLAILGWTSIIVQCYLGIEASVAKCTSFPMAVVNVLSYFTILTNILVATVLTASALNPAAENAIFLLRPKTRTAVATYILIVAFIYELALRRLWSPVGLHFFVDVALHYVVPIGYFLYWLSAVPKGSLRYSFVGRWMLYPLAYLIYTVVRSLL
jgi:hypothetical protein